MPKSDTQFRPGHASKGGRPVGSRQLLSTAFLDALHNDFCEGGVEAIAACRKTDPSTYVRVVASLLPKEVSGADGEALLVKVLQITAEDLTK